MQIYETSLYGIFSISFLLGINQHFDLRASWIRDCHVRQDNLIQLRVLRVEIYLFIYLFFIEWKLAFPKFNLFKISL
jgi:hypothetical protein